MKVHVAVFVFILFLHRCEGEEGYFWHFTDVHWDFSYSTPNPYSCTFKTVNRGPYGEYFCDSPWRLIEEIIKQAKRIKPDVDFILWTGDTAPHVKAEHLTTDIIISQIYNITELIEKYFPGVPLYPNLGNHDYHPQDQFPPHTNKIYNASYSFWKPWIGDTQEQSFLKGAYYTVKTKFGLRVIALNTNLYYNDDLTKHLTDPADQFSWLENQLSVAALNNEKVIITGHVPPGATPPIGIMPFYSNFNERFVNTVLRHSSTVTALHFGHEHHDNFRLFYNSSGCPVVPLFIAPSVTPQRLPDPKHNPGVRLIKYDRQVSKQLDILQYYVDLPTANRENHVNLTFGYSATQEYGIPDIMPESLAALVNKLKNTTYFQQYWKWYNVNAVNKYYPCNLLCRKIFLCAMRYLKNTEYHHCVLTPGQIIG